MTVRISHRLSKGFTIVELLIVVVVIAILAAITIVAYNGIQSRAKTSAVLSTTKQAFTKIQTYATLNAEQFPVDVATAGLSTDGGVSYQYRVDNASNPRKFCVTVTKQSISAWVSESSSAPVLGACSGHAVDGVPTITNLLTNPSIEGSLTTWQGTFGAFNTVALSNSPYYSGSTAVKYKRESVSSDARMGRHQIGTLSAGSYVYSSWVYIQDAAINNVTPAAIFASGAGTQSPATSTGASTNQWKRVSVPFTVTTAGNVYIDYYGGQSQVGAISIDAAMLEQGSTLHTYADGESDSWVWNGSANASTSTGPAL